MRHRGSQYWFWADSQLYNISHEEVGHDGLVIDIKARKSRVGEIQLFVGIYSKEGYPIREEYLDQIREPCLEKAICWGLERARSHLISLNPHQSKPAN